MHLPDIKDAEQQLTDMQRALVDAVVDQGVTITKAAEIAGYGSASAGHNAMRKSHVQTYLSHRIAISIGHSAALAARRLSHLVDNAKSEYVQLEASRDLLDRAGYKPPDRKQVAVHGDVSVRIDLG